MFGKLTSPRLIILIPLVLALIFAVACGSTAVQQEPRVVEKEVIKEVPVEVVVEKEVITVRCRYFTTASSDAL